MSTMQNLQAFQNNDTTFQLQVTQNGYGRNLTGYTLKLFVKASSATPDSSATVYTAGSGLTLTEPLAGMLTFTLPHTAAETSGTQWWRLDVIDQSGNIGTVLYGNLYVLAV